MTRRLSFVDDPSAPFNSDSIFFCFCEFIVVVVGDCERMAASGGAFFHLLLFLTASSSVLSEYSHSTFDFSIDSCYQFDLHQLELMNLLLNRLFLIFVFFFFTHTHHRLPRRERVPVRRRRLRAPFASLRPNPRLLPRRRRTQLP